MIGKCVLLPINALHILFSFEGRCEQNISRFSLHSSGYLPATTMWTQNTNILCLRAALVLVRALAIPVK